MIRWAVITILGACLWQGASSASSDLSSKLLARSRRIQRDLPQQYCNNTLQGRAAVTDDQGFYCTRENFNSQTGCCAKGVQFSCETCSSDNLCCEEYERCVSCCLSPSYKAKDLVQSESRSPGRADTGRWASAFDLCKGKCRTTSHSTVHENAYLSGLHHCFSESGKPTTPGPPLPQLPKGLTAVPAAKGQSCTSACDNANHVCSPSSFRYLNDCNMLRRYFACEAGCDTDSGLEQPSYMVASAPKLQRPTICRVLDLQSPASEFSCDGVHANVQRLCPCLAPSTTYSSSSSSSTSASSKAQGQASQAFA